MGMALTPTQKTQLLTDALKSRETLVDGVRNTRRSIDELRAILELDRELDGTKDPGAMLHFTDMIPPGSLDG